MLISINTVLGFIAEFVFTESLFLFYTPSYHPMSFQPQYPPFELHLSSVLWPSKLPHHGSSSCFRPIYNQIHVHTYAHIQTLKTRTRILERKRHLSESGWIFSSVFLKNSCFYLGIKSHCVYMPYFHYTCISWWTSRLILAIVNRTAMNVCEHACL